jgi:hypothetical protein
MPITRACGLVLLFLAVACKSDVGADMRKATYPPDFAYISKEQLQSTMWQLARDASEVDRLAAKPDPLSLVDRNTLLALLRSMETEVDHIGGEGKRTNHPQLDEKRDQFRADLEAARRGVESEPPNYTLARTVSTACTRCHHQSVR